MPATHARALPPDPAQIPRTPPGGARSSGGRSRARNPDDAEENPRRRRRRRRSRRNPPGGGSVFGLIVIGLAAAGVGYFGYRAARRRMLGATSIDQAVSMGTTLVDAKDVLADLEQPIFMTTTPIEGFSGYSLVPDIVVHAPGTLSAPSPIKLRSVAFGSDAGGGFNDLAYSGRTLDGTEFNGVAPPSADKAIAALVTNVTPQFAATLYRAFGKAMGKGTIDWRDPMTRDATIASVLKNTVPSTDWSRGLEPYAYGSPQSTVWGAAQLMGTIADQAYWNTRLLEEEG